MTESESQSESGEVLAPDADERIECPECGGDGFTDCPECLGDGDDCPKCSEVGAVTCFYCYGSGRIPWGRRRNYEVWIHHFLPKFQPNLDRPGQQITSFPVELSAVEALKSLQQMLGRWPGYGSKTIFSVWFGPVDNPDDRTCVDYVVAQAAPENWSLEAACQGIRAGASGA